MKKYHNKISILYAIYQEYGIETFIKRLKKIYNLDITLSKTATIIFLSDQIIITDEERNINYIIKFKEEYYKFIKDFGTYSVEKSYDMDHNPFRKSYLFKTSDDKILAIDELHDMNMKSKRIIKTDRSDEELLNGEFEKELLTLTNYKATENYDFININGAVTTKKTINMPNCLYYYSYKSKKTIPESQNIFHVIEIGASTNIPKLDFNGRQRANNELLRSSIASKMPNIIIRGTLLSTNIDLKSFYKITILKSSSGITIHYLSTDIKATNTKNKVIVVPTLTEGAITLEEIDSIISALNNNLENVFKEDFDCLTMIEDITKELSSLKDEILISKQQKTRNPDVIDFKLQQYLDQEHLAFDVYEKLASYEEYINNQLDIKPESPGETLKKS